MSWSPDGRQLAYLETENRARDSAAAVADGQVYVVAADGGTPSRRAARGAHPNLGHRYQAPAWSADGSRLYASNSTSLWEIDIEDQSAREVGRLAGKTITHVVTPASGGRVWGRDGGRSIVVLARDDGTKDEGFYAIDLSSGRARAVWEGPRHIATHHVLDCDVPRAANVLVCKTESFQQSPNLWAFSDDGRAPEQITRINPDIEKVALGESRLVQLARFRRQSSAGLAAAATRIQSGH